MHDGRSRLNPEELAKPVALKTPDAAAKDMIGTISYTTQVAGFTTTFAEQFQGTPRDEKTPVSYRLMSTEKGLPTGYECTAKANELAEMTSGFRPAGEPST